MRALSTPSGAGASAWWGRLCQLLPHQQNTAKTAARSPRLSGSSAGRVLSSPSSDFPGLECQTHRHVDPWHGSFFTLLIRTELRPSHGPSQDLHWAIKAKAAAPPRLTTHSRPSRPPRPIRLRPPPLRKRRSHHRRWMGGEQCRVRRPHNSAVVAMESGLRRRSGLDWWIESFVKLSESGVGSRSCGFEAIAGYFKSEP